MNPIAQIKAAWGTPQGFLAAPSTKTRVRRLLHPGLALELGCFLEERPDVKEFCRRRCDIRSKAFRRYLSPRFSFRESIRALIFHYRFLATTGLMKMVDNAAEQPVVLARLKAKDESLYEFVLGQTPATCLEGELRLALRDGAQRELYVAICSVVSFGGEAQLFVGCFQGCGGPGNANLIKTATHDFFHRRPRTVLLHLLQGVAAALGCEGVVLVSNASRHSQSQRVHADYDAMWEEFGAVRYESDFFWLPAIGHVELDMAAIPQKRRVERRRVADMINAALFDIQRCLSLWREAVSVASTWSL